MKENYYLELLEKNHLEYSEPKELRFNIGLQVMSYKGEEIGWLKTIIRGLLEPIEERHIAILNDTEAEPYKEQLSVYTAIEAEDAGYTEYHLIINSDMKTAEAFEQIYNFVELIYKIKFGK